jgi:predicted transcriptional regulator
MERQRYKVVTVRISKELHARLLKYIYDKFSPEFERKKSLVVSRALDEFLKGQGY